MNTNTVIALLAIVFVATVVTQCSEEFYPWRLRGNCSQTCGQCGTQRIERTCKANCTCLNQVETMYALCSTNLCVWPSSMCCTGQKIVEDSAFVCGFPSTATATPAPASLPPPS